MTDTIHVTTLGTVSVRESDDGDGRTIEGLAVPYDVPTDPGATAEYGNLREAFDRGSFAAVVAQRAGRPVPIIDVHRGTVVAGAEIYEADDGLRFRGRLLGSQTARDFAERVAAGLVGVSVEFIPGDTYRKGDTIRHRAVRALAAIAGAYAPAYAGAIASVRSVEGDTTVTDTATTPAIEPAPEATERATALPAGPIPMTPDAQRALIADVAGEILRQHLERGALGGRSTVLADPLHGHGTFARAFDAYATGELRDRTWLVRALAARALDDTVTTAGANAGLLEGALTVARVQRVVNAGRPAITAFGGPRPLTDGTGLNLTWPYFDGTLTDFVGAQSAEKAAITSASMDIKLGSEAIITYAGGTDMSYQLIRRGSPDAIDAWLSIVLAAWAVVTDLAFVTELESGSATLDFAEAATAVDYGELVGHIVDASVTVEAASGSPAEFALMGTTLYKVAAKAVLAQNSQLAANPSADVVGLDIRIGNFRLIHDANVTAGKAIISNRLAAGWHEDGPFQVAAEDVEKLGRNVAIWSLGAGARYIPAAIIEAYDVTP